MNKSGFTLVELLVAAAVFLLAVSTFGYVLNSAKITLNSAAGLNQALYALQAKMEEIKVLPYNSLAALDNTTFANDRGKVSVSAALADLQSIELALTWQQGKAPLKFVTLRSKY